MVNEFSSDMRKRFKKIYIEITNVCNLECDFCPKTIRKPEFMTMDLFKKSLVEAESLTDEITLHIMGEPLIHPKFKEMIEFAKRKNVKINLTTNGTLIKKNYDILLNKTIRRINFSVHGLKSNFTEEKQEEHLKNIIEFTKLAQIKREDMIIIYRIWNLEEQVDNKSDDNFNIKVLDLIEKEFNVKLENKTIK